MALFETQIAIEDLFPENAQLLLGKPVADAAMDARAEGISMYRRICHVGQASACGGLQPTC